MTAVQRVLDRVPVTSLDGYVALGGGLGLQRSLEAAPGAILDVLDDAGLRGRGGAGFPTGVKWRAVTTHSTHDAPAAVVVNAAEGEPGTFKDRAILLANPYRVLEGALIAAAHLGTSQVKVALKASARAEVQRVTEAAAEIAEAAWLPGASIEVVTGPDSYLYGEETALLEVVRGRAPLPRIAPPWRRGIADGSEVPAAADAELAVADGDRTGEGAGETDDGAPALVNNVETFAHVAMIAASGPEWFREIGTAESPGSVVCTVTGRTTNSGVMEVAMGTTLQEVLDRLDARALSGEIVAVLPGVSNRLISADDLDVPLTYEHLRRIGSGLGTAGFIVLDEAVDPVQVAGSVARFLAVESCGQCTPCKQDGLAISDALATLGTADEVERGDALGLIDRALDTIETGARCFLATQHQQVVDSFRREFPASFDAGSSRRTDSERGVDDARLDIAPLLDLTPRGPGVEVRIDRRQFDKQPDWTFDPEDSGKAPADRLGATQGAEGG